VVAQPTSTATAMTSQTVDRKRIDLILSAIVIPQTRS
jgi:hypothetical protein